MAYARGRQSRQTSTFMLAADVLAFDEVLASDINGLACWTTDVLKPDGSAVIHKSLSEALTYGMQAFLRLNEGSGLTGPRLQYLPTDMASGSWAGPRVSPETPDALIRAGRLAYLWFPGDEPDLVQTRFSDLVNVAWRALHVVTAADLVRTDGKPTRSARIGFTTKEWVVNHPGQQLVAWNTEMRLR